MLKGFNFGFAIVTNQSGVGRNYFTKYEFEKFNRYLLEVLVKNDIEVNYISACFHNPELEACECRKPNLKMINSIQSYINTKNCILIGNSDSDKLTATEAKIAYMDCNSPAILEELQKWLKDRNDL
jgi:D-glycero-D-manno-heptose 1,7-bisphosphate phosphatase